MVWERLIAAYGRRCGGPARLDGEILFAEFDVDCDADLILGYNWLREQRLAFLFYSDEVCRAWMHIRPQRPPQAHS